jgi:hypothetical protein
MPVVSKREVCTASMSSGDVCTGPMSNYDVCRRDVSRRDVSRREGCDHSMSTAAPDRTKPATMSTTSAVPGESIGGERQAAKCENCGQCKD